MIKLNYLLILSLILVSQITFAGLPPTTSKITGDSTDTTTFKYRFPSFQGTHTGTLLSISGVNDPTNPQDFASKNYVDTQLNQLNPAQAVYAASTVNIAGSYVNAISGVCIGDTFTTTSTTSPFVVDGATPAVGNRILLKNQTSSFQDGVWTLTTQAVAGVSGAIFTRALDFDSSPDLNAGSIVPVVNGGQAGSSWFQTASNTTCNTSSQTWTQFQQATSSYLLKTNNLSDVSSTTTSFNNISPMTTGGDIIYGGASGAGTRLANGSAGQVLQSNGGTSAETWVSTLSSTVQGNITQTGTITGASSIWNGSPNFYHTLLTSGTTWTSPSTISTNSICTITLVGGGGAGGGNSTSSNNRGAGGGGGGTSINWVSNISPSTNYTYAIGQGGTGVSNNLGNSGGNTTLTINAVTYQANGGGGGDVGAHIAGGTGGPVPTGTMAIPGEDGEGVAGTTQNLSGKGGSSSFGHGAVGVQTNTTGHVNGNNATGYGGGGSGSVAGTSAATVGTGGNGSNGMINIACTN